MNILYLGSNSGTSGQRKAALVRLGHRVSQVNPHGLIPTNPLVGLWQWRTGSLGLTEIVRRRVLGSLKVGQFDLAWIDHGDLVGARLLDDLKARIPRVLCYNIDDPFGGRDRQLWRPFLRALPGYDLVVVMRECNVQEAYDRGAKRVMRVFMSADEVAHAPRQLDYAELERWRSEVVFVGTAFPERGPFFADLARLGVPLALYGARYDRLPEWPALKRHWRGGGMGPDDYAKAIAGAKVCLGLLSKGNRDLHTTRSMEIPSLGGALCAERTSEHLALYQENREAVFWATPEECAAKCFALLADDAWREQVAAAGRRRYLLNPWQNQRVAASILDAALADSPR